MRSFRSLALVFALLLWAAPAWAQFTLVGQNIGLSANGIETTDTDASVTAAAGDLSVITLLFVQPASGCVSNVAVSDATNGAYTINAAANYCDSDNTRRTAVIAYFINSGAAALTPTITWTSATQVAYNHSIWRPTGTVTADQFNENEQSSTTSHSHGSITTTGTGDGLIITVSRQNSDGGVETVASGFTALSNNNINDYGQYKITTTGETTTATYTTANSVTSHGVIASFLDDGGGGAAVPCTAMLLGVGKCD